MAANLPFSVAAEVATSGFVSGTPGAQYITIYVANRAEVTCTTAPSLAGGDTRLASLDLLTVDVVNKNGAVTPGTYDVVPLGSGSGASASYTATTSTCATVNGNGLAAESGSVTLTEVSAANVTGTYSVTFGTQVFSGTFDLAICAAGSGGDAGPPLVCQQ